MILSKRIPALLCIGVLVSCGGSDSPEESAAAPISPPASESPVAAGPAPDAGGAGTAVVSLTGGSIAVSGTFPARLCGGPYMLGEGMSFQTQAGDWQITIASETRASGDIPLNTADGVNVVVTANGPGMQFVRGPSNGGSLTISDDYRRAAADLEVRSMVGRETARLTADFTCEQPA